MRNCNSKRTDRVAEKFKRIQEVHSVNYTEKEQRSDQIEGNVYDGYLSCILLTPMLEISAVTQVPIFCPMMMGIAIPYVMLPVRESACRIPTEAEEL